MPYTWTKQSSNQSQARRQEAERHMNRSPANDGCHFPQSPSQSPTQPLPVHEGSDSKQYQTPFSRGPPQVWAVRKAERHVNRLPPDDGRQPHEGGSCGGCWVATEQHLLPRTAAPRVNFAA